MTLTHNDLQQVGKLLQNQLDPLKQDLEELKKGQRSINRQLTRVKKDIKWIVRNDDTRIVENQRELDKVKHFVEYPASS